MIIVFTRKHWPPTVRDFIFNRFHYHRKIVKLRYIFAGIFFAVSLVSQLDLIY